MDNETLLNRLDPTALPKHVAIIMDGNGRWAKKKLMPRTVGHRAGMKTLKSIVRLCSNMKIPVLTVYAFSTENWKRPQEEVDFLMDLLIEYLHKELEELHENNVNIQVLGDIDVLPRKVKKAIREALNKTENNDGLIFNLALNYGARAEIVRAVKQIAELLQTHQLDIAELDESDINAHLYTAGLPEPDLLIRTAGDMRVSNFLLWQIAYAEIFVTPILWPDFRENDFIQAILEFQNRERRFGGLSSTTL